MAKMDSKVATEKSLKDEDETMEDKDEKATSKIVDDPDKQQGVTTSSRRRSSRAKSNPASPVPPAVKMDIDDEDEAEKQESSTERESNQQAMIKMETEEKLSGSGVPAPPPAADQEKKDGTSATSTPADSNTSVNSQSKKQSEPTGDIAKTEDTLKDSEKDEHNDDDDEIQQETPDDSEEYQDEEDNEEEDRNETKTTGKRRRGKSSEPRPTDSPSRAKRVRNKPIDLYKPVDFGMPKEKATNPKGPAAKAKKSASPSRSSSAPPQRTKGDYITVINGQGMKLKDIPVIRKTVEESDINSQDLYLVHRLLYSYKGRGSSKLFKTHILEFSGYMRKAKEGENEEKVDEENAAHEAFMSTKVFKYDASRLKLYMDFFQIDRTPTEDGPLNKEALVDRLLDFLCAPSLESMNPQDYSSSEEEEEKEGGDSGNEMTNEKRDDAKSTKATEAKKDDTATPVETAAAAAAVSKKKDTDITTKVTKPKTEDAVTVKKADTKAVVSEEPKTKKGAAETTKSAEAPKDTETSTKAQTTEKQVPKKDSKAKEKTKTDPANSKEDDNDDDQPADRQTANAQTYQEWCQKAKIEGAFYLVREHDKGGEPSDAAIRQWVQAYVTCFDMSAATAKHAIETASAKFGVDLTDRKDLIREFIVSEI